MSAMKNLLIIIVLCLPQATCLVAATVEGVTDVTDVAISMSKIPVNVGGAAEDTKGQSVAHKAVGLRSNR